MHADAVVGEAHPVGHGSTHVFAAWRDFVFSGVGVAFHEAAAGIVNFSIEVGSFVFDFFNDAVVAGRRFVGRASGGNAVVHGDFVPDHEETALGGKVDFDVGVGGVGLGEEGGVFPGAGGAGVVGGLEVGVGSRRVGVDEAGLLDGFLFRIGLEGGGAHWGTVGEEKGERGGGECEDVFHGGVLCWRDCKLS